MSKRASVVEEPQFLKVSDVARALNVSAACVYEMVARGDVPSVKIADCVRIAEADLNAYIASRYTGSSARAPRISYKQSSPAPH